MPALPIVDDPAGADAAVAEGAVVERHLLIMVAALGSARPTRDCGEPAASGDVSSIAPMRVGLSGAYAEVMVRAYPPTHPDHSPADEDPRVAVETIESYLRGEQVGPWIAEASMHAVDADGRVLGAVVINRASASAVTDGGPLITDIFVDPSASGRGVGSALISAAIDRLTIAGEPSLSLAVTVGNPAQRLYEHLGFVIRHEVWRLATRD